MTVGQLARRTEMSVRSIRDLEARGLIYSAGRSAANYRLFDDSAFWCIGVIRRLRGLGLTIREIERLETARRDAPDEPVGVRLADVLVRVDRRIGEQIASLEQVRARIALYRREHAAALSGSTDDHLDGADPRRMIRA
jgi:DNA-binding transcriptional MerR regulator